MIPMLVTLSLSFLALCISIFALIAGRRSLVLSRSSRPSELLKRVAELEALIEVQGAQFRNLRTRLNMQAYRERKREREPDEEETETDGAAWRRRMNAELAAGRISALPRK